MCFVRVIVDRLRLNTAGTYCLTDCLRAGWSRDRIPAWARFSTPVQTDPEAHPASCTMGTGSFPGVRCGRGVTLTPHPEGEGSKIEKSYTSTLPKGLCGLWKGETDLLVYIKAFLNVHFVTLSLDSKWSTIVYSDGRTLRGLHALTHCKRKYKNGRCVEQQTVRILSWELHSSALLRSE